MSLDARKAAIVLDTHVSPQDPYKYIDLQALSIVQSVFISIVLVDIISCVVVGNAVHDDLEDRALFAVLIAVFQDIDEILRLE